MRPRGKGRPPTKPAKMMDGFYIEVRNKGARERGVRIRCTTHEEMENTAKNYSRVKDVTILGESRDNKWLEKTEVYGGMKVA